MSSVCCEECNAIYLSMGCMLLTRKVCVVSAVKSVMQYTCRWDVCCRQRKVCLVSAVRSVMQYTLQHTSHHWHIALHSSQQRLHTPFLSTTYIPSTVYCITLLTADTRHTFLVYNIHPIIGILQYTPHSRH